MTREEAISTLEMLRFPEPWEQKLTKRAEEALDMAISALSTEGDYIKKSELLQHVTTEELSDFKDCDVIHAEEIDDLPTYSFPDSKSVINKVLEVIKSQRLKVYDWYASLAPSVGDSWREEYEADMEIYDGVIEAVELYRDSDSAENKGEWIDISTGKGIFKDRSVKCSVCGNTLNLNGVNCGRGDANFCPNCGADMRGDKAE